MKLLIIDDSQLMQDRISSALSELEEIKIVGQATNSFEAYSMHKKYKPDVVILDIRLPGESGIQILEKLKKEDKKLKIIVLTNYPYPQYRKKCLELGADYFLDKSNEFNKLPQLLKKHEKSNGDKIKID